MKWFCLAVLHQFSISAPNSGKVLWKTQTRQPVARPTWTVGWNSRPLQDWVLGVSQLSLHPLEDKNEALNLCLHEGRGVEKMENLKSCKTSNSQYVITSRPVNLIATWFHMYTFTTTSLTRNTRKKDTTRDHSRPFHTCLDKSRHLQLAMWRSFHNPV